MMSENRIVLKRLFMLCMLFSLYSCSANNSRNQEENENGKLGDVNVAKLISDRNKRAQDEYKILEEVNFELANDNSSGSLKILLQGLEKYPESVLLESMKVRVETSLREERIYNDVLLLVTEGKYLAAKKSLDKAIKSFENSPRLNSLNDDIKRVLLEKERRKYLIDLVFEDIQLKDAYRFAANSFGVGVLFDDSFKDKNISLNIMGIPFVEAIDLLSRTNKNKYKVINNETLLIYPDTKDKRDLYEDISVRVFSLQTMAAKDMSAIVKSVLSIKNIIVNESNNSLIITEKPSILNLAEELITINDVAPGEVVLDVEILEINLTETERLGIDYGNVQLSTTTASVPTAGRIIESISNSTTLNVPSISLNAFKQAVNAKSLARPSIRVIDGEKAKIHIGDRVPLRKSSIQDATGQTRTTFEYQEIGIRFNVEAKIHSKESVTVKVGLEVSTLGENLGTATEQAFRIGTRNADTTMLVQNGETAVLGGLLREEGRGTNSGISGLGDVSFLKKIFGSEDISSQRTDLLLTVTPNIIRYNRHNNLSKGVIELGSQTNLSAEGSLKELDKLVLVKKEVTSVGQSMSRAKLKVEIQRETGESANVYEKSDTESVKPEEPYGSINIQILDKELQGHIKQLTAVPIEIECSEHLYGRKIYLEMNDRIAKPAEIIGNESWINVILDTDSSNKQFFTLNADDQNDQCKSEIVTMDLMVEPLRKGTTYISLSTVNNAGESVKSDRAKLTVK